MHQMFLKVDNITCLENLNCNPTNVEIKVFLTTTFLLQKPIRILAYLYLPACLIYVPGLEYTLNSQPAIMNFHFILLILDCWKDKMRSVGGRINMESLSLLLYLHNRGKQITAQV